MAWWPHGDQIVKQSFVISVKKRLQTIRWLICLLAAGALCVAAARTFVCRGLIPRVSAFFCGTTVRSTAAAFGQVAAPTSPPATYDPFLGTASVPYAAGAMVAPPGGWPRLRARSVWRLVRRLAVGPLVRVQRVAADAPAGECGAPVEYGWEPHPLLLQAPAPIAAPVAPRGSPHPWSLHRNRFCLTVTTRATTRLSIRCGRQHRRQSIYGIQRTADD